MADEEGQGGDDPRIAVLQQYTLKTMKQKNDKWAKVSTQIHHAGSLQKKHAVQLI